MRNTSVSIVISLVTIFVGLSVSLSWIFDIPSVQSLLPNAVTMKFSTAISFVFSGLTVFSIALYHRGHVGVAQIALPISGLVIFLFMVTILTATVFDIDSGIEQIFVKEGSDAVKTINPGLPSLPTMMNFILILMTGMFALSESKLNRLVSYVGYIIATVGAISVIGYAVNQPSLYYYIDTISTAMALHTSLLFVGLGVSLILLKGNAEIQQIKSVKIQTKIVSLFFAASLIPIIFIVGLNFNLVDDFSNKEYVKSNIIMVSLVTVMAVSMFSVLTARSISRPIIDLKETSTQISKGNFSVKAVETSNDEIGDLAKSFNKMVKDVIKTERLSSIGLLASYLGHDVKNSLTAIKMATDLLKTGYGDKMNEDMKSKISLIEKSTNNISSQINDILDFVRSTPNRVEHSQFSKLLDSALKIVKIPESIMIKTPANDILVKGDTRKLEIVLMNLITNSIQAIADNGQISVRIDEDTMHSIIEVEDSGAGIPEDVLAKIFEPLFTTKRTGTGLGLASCKNIIEDHGGIISVKNNPTIFTVKLPKP